MRIVKVTAIQLVQSVLLTSKDILFVCKHHSYMVTVPNDDAYVYDIKYQSLTSKAWVANQAGLLIKYEFSGQNKNIFLAGHLSTLSAVELI